MKTELAPSAAALAAAHKILPVISWLILDWQRQDDELASARSGLAMEDRVNEEAENKWIADKRLAVIASMLDRNFVSPPPSDPNSVAQLLVRNEQLCDALRAVDALALPGATHIHRVCADALSGP